ncbi:MAG TPA: EAL domain-containing protein, partial [Lysobacter sp.]
ALAALRDRGVRLSFDDFGTGFASLSMLQRFPIDRVKIDRSFVRDMLDNRGDAAIVKSIVLISRNMELHVTAEGVESQAQAELLRGLGCNAAQGFLYSPALSPRAFEDWLASQTADPAAAPWRRLEPQDG